LGGTTGYIIREVLTHEQLVAWGWRIPFLMGVSVSFAGCFLQIYGKEDELDDHHHNTTTINHTMNTTRTAINNNISSISRKKALRPANNGITSTYRNDGAPELANTIDHDDSFSGTSYSEEGEFQNNINNTNHNHPINNNYLNEIVDDDEDDDEDDDIVIITTRSNPCLRAIQRDNIRPLIAATMVPMLWTAGFYLAFVWMSVYMSTLSKHPIHGSYGINSVALLCSVTFFFPVAGTLSDRYGRVYIMTIGGTGMAIIAPLMFYIIGLGNPFYAFIAQCVIGISLSLWGGPMCSWLVESFEPEARLTSVAIGYNMAHALVGGTTPAFATWLVDNSPNNESAPGILFTVLAIISLIGLRFIAPSSSTQQQYRRHRPTRLNNILHNNTKQRQLSSFVEIEMQETKTTNNLESVYTKEENEIV
jgi:Major Facilitator Superfamily